MLNEVRIPSGKLLMVLIVHHQNIICPRQVVGGDLGGDVPGEIVAGLCGDPRHCWVSVPADVPVVGAAGADFKVDRGIVRSQGSKHGLSGR
jgi:hypothetical protein